MTSQPAVQIKNLKKNIGRKKIIKGISFDVNRGEVFGFLGPNGAGKTTTIRMLLGLMSITEGEILIDGHSIKKNFEKAIASVGGIVENPDMYGHLSGYNNLLHYARMYANVKKERIDEVTKLVGLENRIKDRVKTYSLGMRQRLGLAQALLHSPSLLVLDEPTNGLDPEGIHELRSTLRNLAEKENIAVFVSSHLLSEMEQMCDRVAIIKGGNLVKIQTLEEMLQEKTGSTVIFEVDQLEKAKASIEKLDSTFNPVINENELEVSVDHDEVPVIVKALVQEKIKIYGVTRSIKNLEDKYLEMTGGSGIE